MITIDRCVHRGEVLLTKTVRGAGPDGIRRSKNKRAGLDRSNLGQMPKCASAAMGL